MAVAPLLEYTLQLDDDSRNVVSKLDAAHACTDRWLRDALTKHPLLGGRGGFWSLEDCFYADASCGGSAQAPCVASFSAPLARLRAAFLAHGHTWAPGPESPTKKARLTQDACTSPRSPLQSDVLMTPSLAGAPLPVFGTARSVAAASLASDCSKAASAAWFDALDTARELDRCSFRHVASPLRHQQAAAAPAAPDAASRQQWPQQQQGQQQPPQQQPHQQHADRDDEVACGTPQKRLADLAGRIEQPEYGTPVSVKERINVFDTLCTVGSPAFGTASPARSAFGQVPPPPLLLALPFTGDGAAAADSSASLSSSAAAAAAGSTRKDLLAAHEAGETHAGPPAARSAPSVDPLGSSLPSLAANVGAAMPGSGSAAAGANAAEVYERLAAGGRREDLAKPKSLRAAEQAKLLEEKRARERLEREQERERARQAEMAKFQDMKRQQQAAKPGTQQPSPHVATAPASTGSRSALRPKNVQINVDEGLLSKANRPPVPLFKPEPNLALKQIHLPPKKDEDNYEISDGADSDVEDRYDRDRSGKAIPIWCDTYLDVLATQADLDPDSIFGRVPHCSLEDVFSEAGYKESGRSRPKRARGSSGDWRRDKLRFDEIRDYKAKMGQTKSWDALALGGAGASGSAKTGE